MPEPADFEPMDSAPADRGEPSRSARDIARTAAAEAVRGKVEADTDQPLDSEERQTAQFEEMDRAAPDEDLDYEEDLGGEQAVPDKGAAEVDSAQLFTKEDYQALQEMGIDLPVAPDDVPAEFQGTYAEMAQAIIDSQHRATEQSLEAQQAMMRIQQFGQRLSTPEGQQRLLLTLALNNPEAFETAVQTATRMQEDPDYADMVRQRMEAEARMEAATRKEQAIERTQRQTKGQQVEARTVRLARRMGVNPDLAKESVAHRILLNESQNGKRDITLSEVDEIVKTLARRTGAKPRVKQPEAQRREAQAPTKPAEGTGRTPPPQDEAPRGRQTQESSDPLDRLRNAVKLSSRRVRSQGL